jgi:hypothetical protein
MQKDVEDPSSNAKEQQPFGHKGSNQRKKLSMDKKKESDNKLDSGATS